jgi:DNA polymerase
MFLDEFDKEIQKKFLMKEFVAGWQNRPGKVDIIIIGTEPGMIGACVNRKPLGNSHSGKLLSKLLKESHLNNETVYVTNLIKYPLLNNRDPTLTEINENKTLLDAEIEKYNPRLVLCLGKYSMQVFGLQTYKIKVDNYGITFAAINHPGYYLRKPSSVKTAISFLSTLVKTE